jgi:phytoene dehydrogenase-like protein
MREPPDPTSFKPRDIMELLYLGKRFHGLGEERMYDTLRFWTMSAADFLDEYFESEIVKAHFAGSSIIGTALGPRSPGHGLRTSTSLHGRHRRYGGRVGFRPRRHGCHHQGAWGRLSKPAAAPFAVAAPVTEILVKNERTVGVVLENGEEVHAPLVISNMDVKRTFLTTMNAKHLPDEFVKQVKNFKIRGSSGKLNIALDGLPRFPAIPEGSPSTRGDMHVTDTLEMMERAYDDWKEGAGPALPTSTCSSPRRSIRPWCPMASITCRCSCSTVRTSSRAVLGRPRSARPSATRSSIPLRSIVPNFKDLILHAEIRTPWDIENEVGLTEGNIFPGRIDHGSTVVQSSRCRAMRSIVRRCAACTCAAPAPIPAAA